MDIGIGTWHFILSSWKMTLSKLFIPRASVISTQSFYCGKNSPYFPGPPRSFSEFFFSQRATDWNPLLFGHFFLSFTEDFSFGGQGKKCLLIFRTCRERLLGTFDFDGFAVFLPMSEKCFSFARLEKRVVYLTDSVLVGDRKAQELIASKVLFDQLVR